MAKLKFVSSGMFVQCDNCLVWYATDDKRHATVFKNSSIARDYVLDFISGQIITVINNPEMTGKIHLSDMRIVDNGKLLPIDIETELEKQLSSVVLNPEFGIVHPLFDETKEDGDSAFLVMKFGYKGSGFIHAISNKIKSILSQSKYEDVLFSYDVDNNSYFVFPNMENLMLFMMEQDLNPVST